MSYFLISTNEDGDHYVEALTEKELLDRLNGGYYGDDDPPVFEESLPDYNMAYWPDSCLIIKGEIVVPKAKEVTTVYEIE